jgi:hypothetical protein
MVFRFFGLKMAKGAHWQYSKGPPDAAVVASGTILKHESKIFSTFSNFL